MRRPPVLPACPGACCSVPAVCMAAPPLATLAPRQRPPPPPARPPLAGVPWRMLLIYSSVFAFGEGTSAKIMSAAYQRARISLPYV